MKPITFFLVAFLILVAAGCNNAGQPLTPASTQEKVPLSKKGKRSIWVREGTVWTEGTVYLNGQRYDMADGETIEIPITGERDRVDLWECIWNVDHYECRWDSYLVENGGRYVVVNDEPYANMTLVSE